MEVKNKLKLKFSAISENESFARLAVASFCSNTNLTIEDITDIKTAVSEGVTNCIVHGYDGKDGEVEINVEIMEGEIHIEIIDWGVGIENVEEAQKPFYTSKPESERSGMGFTVMEGFMDKMIDESKLGEGTKVTLIKKISK